MGCPLADRSGDPGSSPCRPTAAREQPINAWKEGSLKASCMNTSSVWITKQFQKFNFQLTN